MNTKMMMYPCSYIDPCKFMSCLRICSCLLSLFHWSKHSDLHAALLLYPIFRIRGAGMVEPAFCVATVLVNHMMNHIVAVVWPCFRKYMTQEWKQNTYPRTNTCTLTTDSDKINHFTKMVAQDIEVLVSNSKSFGDITGFTVNFPSLPGAVLIECEAIIRAKRIEMCNERSSGRLKKQLLQSRGFHPWGPAMIM